MAPCSAPLAAAYRADSLALLRGLSGAQLASAGGAIRAMFHARTVFSTVFDGVREDRMSSTDAADLAALAGVLPEGTLLRDQALRDFCSGEPALLQHIRQIEGHPPAVIGALAANSVEALKEALSEARALGFRLDSGDRRLGVLPPCGADEGEIPGYVTVFGGTSWATLSEHLASRGATIAGWLPDRFPTPLTAIEFGVAGPAPIEHRFGQPWQATARLLPASIERSERVWAFSDARRAEDVLKVISERHAPIFMETICALDAAVMSAARLWRGHRRYRDIGAAGLRVVFEGPSLARRAALAEASWEIERRGGVCHHRGALPVTELLDAMAVSAGAARFVRLDAQGDLPPASLVFDRWTATGRDIRKDQVVWYIRDLAQSLPQAALATGTATADVAQKSTNFDSPRMTQQRRDV